MYKQITFFLIVLAAAAFLRPANAQDDDAADVEIGDESRNCIDLRSVRRTEVVDDRNILFHMRGSTVYHNILPRQCGGLAREDRFSYETTMGRLCSQDMIRVLYMDPFGLRDGNHCQLGVFHKISREDAKAFKEGASAPPAANPLPMPAPQEVGGDKTAPEEPESGTR